MQRVSSLLQEAVRLHRAGNLAEASALYEQVPATEAGHADALHLLGVIASHCGDAALAIDRIERAIAASPNVATYHCNLGRACKARGDQERANQCYRRAIALDPRHADALFEFGSVLMAEQDYAGAIVLLERAVAVQPSAADAWNNLGLCYGECGRPTEAKRSLAEAIRLNPEYATAHFNLGSQHAAQGEHRLAIACFDQAIALRPGYAKAWHSRGSACHALFDLDAAVHSYRQALQAEPGYLEVLANLGATLAMQGSAEGFLYLERLIAERPESAEAHWNLAIALLLHGSYERGWREYEWRWQWKHFPSPQRAFPQPQWRGEPLGGATILLHAEQGLGDTLQFVRYAPLVAARGGCVVLEMQRPLQRLLAGLPGVAACLAHGDPLPDFTWHCPLMSLPAVFGTDLATIPLPVADGMPRTHRQAGTGLQTGLVWAGNPDHRLDGLRSIPLRCFFFLAAVKSVQFYALQTGTAATQAHDWPGGLPDLCAAVKDFADTAEAIARLDLVITVDTAVAHLAASMGKPVWVLLSHMPDWRWGLTGDTSPWYPSARLFRKAAEEDWSAVLIRVKNALSVDALA